MKTLKKYTPYLYFLTIIVFLFSNFNNSTSSYSLLILAIPFLWQIIKPNRKLRFALGVTTICVSSYLILGYFTGVLNIISLTDITDQHMIFSRLFVILNFIMSLWIIRSSMIIKTNILQNN